MSYKITGGKEIEKKLNEVKKTASTQREKALNKIGQIAVGIIKRNTPVDSGRLRNSMSYSIGGKVFEYKESAADAVLKNKANEHVIIGTNVEYANKVETMPSQVSGFFLRSVDAIQPMADDILEKYLKSVIK